MMNIVGNQIIHEAADHYGWKEGSTEKLLLHGVIGALTGSMNGGNALSGAVSGSVNEFALAYMEKTKGRNWMDTHPDTVQAISTALGAVAGSLTGDRNTGAYTAQMGTKWNYYEKYPNMKEKIDTLEISSQERIINQVNKVKIVKKEYLDEQLLVQFYDYMKLNKIEETEDTEKADLIISFGGDGTLLVAAKETLKKDIPVMAVNMGTLGYLADISSKDVIQMMEKYKKNQYIVDERTFLKVKYNEKEYYALNDLVISKGGIASQIINVEVYANGTFVNKYRADGIIVATPTGSTAYSLSAGGSIVHPNLRALSITPLSAQSLTARPIIIDGDEVLSFKVFSRDNDTHLNIDGRINFRIKLEDKISAVMSKKKVRIIRSGKSDYYGILREKLRWGESSVK